MDKQEFIDRLRMALNSRVSPDVVADEVNYYEDYINTQIRMGKNESDVLRELGDPRLIAKTIADTQGQNTTQDAEYRDYSGGYEAGEEETHTPMQFKVGNLTIPGWLQKVLTIALAVIGIGLVLSILNFLAPLILVIAVVFFCAKLFGEWLK